MSKPKRATHRWPPVATCLGVTLAGLLLTLSAIIVLEGPWANQPAGPERRQQTGGWQLFGLDEERLEGRLASGDEQENEEDDEGDDGESFRAKLPSSRQVDTSGPSSGLLAQNSSLNSTKTTKTTLGALQRRRRRVGLAESKFPPAGIRARQRQLVV